MNLFKTIFLFTIFCIPYFTINGQDWDYSYTHFGKEDGLPSNMIYCMVADLDGILWVGTDAGLVRFDGSHIKTYTIKDGLPSNDIFDLFCDSKNRVWITSMSKQASYVKDGILYTAKNDSILSKMEIPNRISHIVENNKNKIIIVSFPFSINIINSKHVLQSFSMNFKEEYCYKCIQVKDKTVLISEFQTFFMEADSNEPKQIRIKKNTPILDLILIKDTIYYLNKTDNKIWKSHINKLNLINFKSSSHFRILFNEQDCGLWVLSNRGIDAYNFANLSEPCKYLKTKSPSFFLSDKFKNCWVSTLGDGLFKINSKSNRIWIPRPKNNDDKIHSILLTEKYIILGLNNGVINILNKENHHLVKDLNINEKTKVYKAYKFIKMQQQNTDKIIITTELGVYTYNLLSGKLVKNLDGYAFKNLYKDGDKFLALTNSSIITSDSNFITSINQTTFCRLYSYAPYQNNTMIGAEDGLYTFNQNVLKPYPLNDTLNSRIMDMQVKDSILLLATVDKGIYFIHKHQIIQHLQVSDGLSSNNCNKMKVYKNKLYVATNKGMSIYDFTTQKINTLYESDGLASTMVNDFDIDQDTIYAATDNGLSMIAIQNIRTDKSYPLFNKPTYVGNDTIWDRKNYFVTQTGKPFQVMLNALTYQTKGNVLFYYRYKNGDKLFKETSDQLIPLYFETPGDYDFEAYAVDANNYKSNLLSIRIFVKPYYWQTLWFKTIVIIGFIGCLVLLFYFLLKRVKMNEEIKRQRESRMHHLELSAWRAKINPHFLFNSLNTLQYLFTANKIEKANEYMSSFSKILRTTIDNSGKLLNTVAGEHDYLEKYLRLESFKRKNTFSYKITINDVGIHQYYIPSLILQPVVENSLKHGLKGNDKGEILVHFQLNEFDILCSIQDNGKGFEDYNHLNPEHKSHGIQLIHDKLRILESVLNQHFIFTFETLYDKHGIIIGSKTSFIFPLITKNVE